MNIHINYGNIPTRRKAEENPTRRKINRAYRVIGLLHQTVVE